MNIQKRVAGTSYPISTTAPPQPAPMPEKYGIKTQQGFSQHILWLSQQDAKIYTELLTRNNIWWADVTNGGVNAVSGKVVISEYVQNNHEG